MTDTQTWIACNKPKLNDTLRWNEPLWAEPSKPRGKKDKIGEQQITATLIKRGDLLEFQVIDVKKISIDDAPVHVTKDDIIKRKKTTIEMGDCQRLIAE